MAIMLLTSINATVLRAAQTFYRFPLSMLSAILGTIMTIYLMESSQMEDDLLSKILFISFLGLPLFLALSLYSEARKHPRKVKVGLQLAGIVVLLFYGFSFENVFTQATAYRFLLINLSLQLAVSFSAFTKKGLLNAFWQFNKTLFLRLLTSLFYSLVLFIGLAAAMVISNVLFSLHFSEKQYVQLWIFVNGIFNTWMFLAGVPQNFEALEKSHDYPKELKIFTQFILLPLLGIYLFILYLYLLKIIFTLSLPKGFVGWLVNIFSFLGILSFLLIYPLREQEGNKWIRIFNQYFFYALFPLIGLLSVAIGVRITEYGLTENRYLALAIAIWLTFIATYYSLKGFYQIKLIPQSLFVMCLLSAVGPWNAFHLSIYSQQQRLLNNLEKVGMLREGAIYPVDSTMGKDYYKILNEVYDGIQYLAERNAADQIIQLLAEPIDDTLLIHEADNRLQKSYMISSTLIAHLKLEPYLYRFASAVATEEEHFVYHRLIIQPNALVNTRGASRLLEITYYETDSLFKKHQFGQDTTQYIQLNKTWLLPEIKKRLANLTMRNQIFKNEYQIIVTPDELYFQTQDLANIKGIQFNSVDITISPSDTTIQNYRCWLMLE